MTQSSILPQLSFRQAFANRGQFGLRGQSRFDSRASGDPAALCRLFTFDSDRLQGASLRASRNALM